jgi:Tol biopolymer transport system component
MHRRFTATVLASMCLAALAGPAQAGAGRTAADGGKGKPHTVRVTQGADGSSAEAHAGVSANGRYVVFSSGASNLVPGDTNGVNDVFVRDLHTGRIQRVSEAPDGSQSDKASFGASISADGRHVAFVSWGAGLVPGVDPAKGGQVYVRDLRTGALTLVGGPLSGCSGASCDWPFRTSVSGDGRYVVWTASGRAHGNVSKLAVKDMRSGRVEVAPAGIPYDPQISDDGRVVVYSEGTNNPVRQPAWAAVWTRGTDTVQRLDAAPDGTPGSKAAYGATVSADGRYAAFFSQSDLLPADPNDGGSNVFLRDLRTGELRRIDAPGLPSDAVAAPALSGDHRHVVFRTVRGVGTEATSQLFRLDLRTGRTVLLSTDHSGEPTDAGFSYGNRALDRRGRTLVFWSDGENLAAGQRSPGHDVYARLLPGGGGS